MACASAPRITPPDGADPHAPHSSPAVQQNIEIQIDEWGVPHIAAQTDAALLYALGYMHARDRLFQLLVLRHAAAGRLSEILGEAHLTQDRRLRLLDWRLEESAAKLSKRDRKILMAYVDGINAGAMEVGPSWYMRVMGLDFPRMEIVDVLRITRLYAWEMDAGLEEELARARIIGRLPTEDARSEALLAPVPSESASIVAPKVPRQSGWGLSTAATHNAVPEPLIVAAQPVELPEEGAASVRSKAAPRGQTWRPTKDFLGLGSGTAWALSGAHTKSGAPLLVAAPEGGHRSPALLYEAHLEHADFSWAGATLPGTPMLLVGQTPHLAWSATASNVDTQDLVEVPFARPQRGAVSEPGGDSFFTPWPQEFRVGRKIRRRETWLSTPIGPVLPGSFAAYEEVGHRHALLWTGFLPEALAEQFSGYLDLARARSLADAELATEKIGIPTTNLLLAFADGTIAYRLSGYVAHREGSAPHDRPRPLRRDAPMWRDRLTEIEKPRVDNPPSGVLVIANQRIVEENDASFPPLGADAALPYRAIRIHQLLAEKRQQGLLKADDALSLQQDVLGLAALRLIPIFATHCPRWLAPFPRQVLADFCEALASFDGNFHPESRGAMPFSRLREALFAEILSTHLGEDVVDQLLDVPFITAVLSDAIVREHAGHPHPLLDDRRSASREGLPVFIARASRRALRRMQQEGWPLRSQWGDFHRFRSRPLLPVPPVVSALWDTVDVPQGGTRDAVRGESEGQLTRGALMRFVAELDGAFHGAMILDGEQRESWPGAPFPASHRDWQQGKARTWRESAPSGALSGWRTLRLNAPVHAP